MSRLGREWIAAHIPHAGSMCLLDAVAQWDEAHIVCETASHAHDDNPMREGGVLATVCGIEYAAQAMAVHAALCMGDETGGGAPAAGQRHGYLGSARDVRWHTPRLDTMTVPLVVRADRIAGDSTTALYRFALSAGEQTVLTGRATVVLRTKERADD